MYSKIESIKRNESATKMLTFKTASENKNVSEEWLHQTGARRRDVSTWSSLNLTDSISDYLPMFLDACRLVSPHSLGWGVTRTQSLRFSTGFTTSRMPDLGCAVHDCCSAWRLQVETEHRAPWGGHRNGRAEIRAARPRAAERQHKSSDAKCIRLVSWTWGLKCLQDGGRVVMSLTETRTAQEPVLGEKLGFALGHAKLELSRRHSSRDFKKLKFEPGVLGTS